MSDKSSRESNDSTGPSRRQVLATIGGVSGLAALAMGSSTPREASADGNLGIGGGAMADEMSNLLARVYSGTLAERDSAGVEGRLYVVHDPGAAEHGEVYRDTGSAWELEDRQYGSINSEQVSSTSVDTDSATIGEGLDKSGIAPRPQVNNSKTTVQINSGDSIQGALNEVPIHLRHDYVIEIDETAGDFDEDLIIPPFYSVSMNNGTNTDDNRAELILTRQGTTGRWTTSSIYGHGGGGPSPTLSIDHPEITAESPYDDENAGIAIYGGRTKVYGPKFTPDTSITRGVMAYGAYVSVDGSDTDQIDFSAGSVSDAFYAKNGGNIEMDGSPSNYTGTATTATMRCHSGWGIGLTGAMGDNWAVGGNASFIFKDDQEIFGPQRFSVSNVVDNLKMENENTGTLFDVIRRSSSNNNIVINDASGTSRIDLIEGGFETSLNDGNGNRNLVAGASGNVGRGEIRDTNGARFRVNDSGDVEFFDSGAGRIAVLRESSGDLDITGVVNENQSL